MNRRFYSSRSTNSIRVVFVAFLCQLPHRLLTIAFLYVLTAVVASCPFQCPRLFYVDDYR
jgi:hypothetical protein